MVGLWNVWAVRIICELRIFVIWWKLDIRNRNCCGANAGSSGGLCVEMMNCDCLDVWTLATHKMCFFFLFSLSFLFLFLSFKLHTLTTHAPYVFVCVTAIDYNNNYYNNNHAPCYNNVLATHYQIRSKHNSLNIRRRRRRRRRRLRPRRRRRPRRLHCRHPSPSESTDQCTLQSHHHRHHHANLSSNARPITDSKARHSRWCWWSLNLPQRRHSPSQMFVTIFSFLIFLYVYV